MPVDQSGYWVPPTTVHLPELRIPHPPGYIYRSTIPEATTQIPSELLKEYYGDRANVRDWTDPNGVLRKQQEMYNKYPQHAVRPIGSSGLIGRWPRPNGLRAVPVPVYGAGTVPDGSEVIVEFRNRTIRNRDRPSIGISMGDIHQGSSDALEGAGDIVLDRFRGRDLKFIIAWPGYECELYTVQTRRETDGGPLTRFDLAEQIMTAYGRLFKKVQDESLLPSEVGFYNIALHQGQNSKKDSLGVQFMQLHLLKFHNTIGGHWVADIEIV